MYLLVAATTVSVLHQVRLNMLLLLFHTGLRPESLVRLRRTWEFGTATDGTRFAKTVLGTMKNHQASFDKVDMPLLKVRVHASPDSAVCAVAALERQIALLPAGEPPDAPLFRSTRVWTQTLGTTPLTVEGVRSATQWVSEVIGRPVTTKDIGRRRVFSMLANDPNFSDHQAAKFMSVRPRTVGVYHRAQETDAMACANALMSSMKVCALFPWSYLSIALSP